MNILVVGANKGLGLVLSRFLAEQGNTVFVGVVGTDYDPNLFAAAGISALPMDVTDESQLAAAQQFFSQRGIELDAIINVAGVLLPEDLELNLLAVSRHTLEKSLEVNAIGNVLLAKYLLPALASGGRFFMVTSEAGSVTNNGSGFPAYSVSKAAANKIAFVLDATFGTEYRFLAIHPGRMNTDMNSNPEIEPIESAQGIYRLLTADSPPPDLFVDYNGEAMQR